MTYTEAFLSEREALTVQSGGARVATRVQVGGAAGHVTDWYQSAELAREAIRGSMYYDVCSGRDKLQNRTYYLITGQPYDREIYSHASHGVTAEGQVYEYDRELWPLPEL